MTSTTSQKVRRFAAYILAWTVAGLFHFSRELTPRMYFGNPAPWQDLLAAWMTGMYICAALSPAILWLGRRWPIEHQNWPRRAALHFLFSICFSAVELALEAVVYPKLGLLSSLLKGSFWSSFSVLLVVGFHGNVLTYWIVLGIQSGYRYYRRYQERELQASELKTQLVRAQLGALKMQLQPHFLFNTLNAIMVLVRQQKGRQAEEMLARLSDLLRSVLEDVEAHEVPLRRELEYLQLYLAIEQVRFQDRLRVEISADPEVLDAAVPHMVLQPIVENAVRHGIGRSSAAGKIEICASRAEDTVKLEVRDDGPGLPPPNAANGRGIGLANTRARLHQLYGDSAKLTIENGARGGAVATIVLPYRLAHEISEAPLMELHAADNADR